MAKRNEWIVGVVTGLLVIFTASAGRTVGGADAGRKEIEACNQKFIDAHLKMDNAAIIGMWAEDGVSLLPERAPMVGKKTIAKFIEGVVARMPGYHMRTFEIDFEGIEANGECASEWATEHQIVAAPPGKENFEGYGKMLLVLHKEADGNWRITREMWNQGIKS
jgi:uncharacterized protein (TIGR02246 family)